MDETQIARLAGMANQLRPDWPINSLITGIRRDLGNRAYRDAAVALAWVAADPDTDVPKRVAENGPWWRAAAIEADKTAYNHITPCAGHPEHPATRCPLCTPTSDNLPTPERVAELAALAKANARRRAQGATS